MFRANCKTRARCEKPKLLAHFELRLRQRPCALPWCLAPPRLPIRKATSVRRKALALLLQMCSKSSFFRRRGVLQLALIQILLLAMLFTCHLSARSIYAFVGTDTLSALKDSCKMDSLRVQNALKGISEVTGMKLHLKVFTGSKLSPKNLKSWLKALKPTSDDVVYFHFSGHGRRTIIKKTRWPSMYFTVTKELVSLREVIDTVKRRAPQLAIIFADCCNNDQIPRTLIKLPNPDVVLREKDGLEKLFTHTKGMIIASASTSGGVAWCSQYGGIFTNAFLYSLQEEAYKVDPDWKHIFKKTNSFCKELQKPVIKLSLK